jgi:hypothetical protein
MRLSSSAARCDWLERARLVEASRVIARQESGSLFPRGDPDLHKLFNLRTGWFLDCRPPVVQRIHALRAAHLKGGVDRDCGERL